VLALMLVPFLFTKLADAVSLSQARRAAGFMPLAFSVAGGAALLARIPAAAIPVSLAAGIALQLAWPGEFGYRFHGNAPAAAAWIAAWGGLAALVLGLLVRRRTIEEARGPLVVLAAALFVAPVAWHGLAHFEPPARGLALPAGLVDALRQRVAKGDVVFSDPETSYRIAAFAPVYIAAAPASHVADTRANRPRARVREVNRFLKTGRLAIPRRFGARWIVLDRRRFELRLRLPVAFRDSRYTLYRL
jgi:hypothetical protein